MRVFTIRLDLAMARRIEVQAHREELPVQWGIACPLRATRARCVLW